MASSTRAPSTRFILGRMFPQDDAGYCISLSEPERKYLEGILSSLPDALHLPQNVQRPDLALVGHALPHRLLGQLAAFNRYGNQLGAFLIRNLPLEAELPSTPRDGMPSPDKATRISEYSLLTIMCLIGHPIGYADEKSGALVHDVCPVPGREVLQENTGSQDFDFHTENAFHRFPPDYVGLLCLRSDHEQAAHTFTASVREAVERLPLAQRKVLAEPVFWVRPPSSFGQGTAGVGSNTPTRVLREPLDDPTFRIDFHNTVATTPESQEALDHIKIALSDVAAGIVLLPGDLLVIDNSVAAHGRSAFTPRYDGQDRWLQRLYAVRDLRASRISREQRSHVLESIPA